MAETWPLGTELNVSGFGQKQQANTIRTTMEAGVDKLRRRYSSPIRNVSGSLILSFDDYETLEDFYNVTLAGGVLSFNFPDQATGVLYEHRFLETPSYTAYGPLHYQVTLKFERIT